jgi:hypothetical protein
MDDSDLAMESAELKEEGAGEFVKGVTELI